MKLSTEEWNMDHLHQHLQAAVDLELWTIPFYMSAMYSVVEKTSEAYQLIRTVVNQEMLHLQSAANIANAYGLSPCINAPVYEGTTVPHLDFSLDNPEVIKPFLPYTAEIGPLDLEHINAMCLIELPEYEAQGEVQLYSSVGEYGIIGAFYEALRFGAAQLQQHIKGGVKQVDFFAPFYRNIPNMTITNSRADGFHQVNLLINLITDQGEGFSKKDETVPAAFQNTADDIAPEDDHFEKFVRIKEGTLPETFSLKSLSDYTDSDHELQHIAVEQFTALRMSLQNLFAGENPENFFVVMSSTGAAIRNCWTHGVYPKFS